MAVGLGWELGLVCNQFYYDFAWGAGFYLLVGLGDGVGGEAFFVEEGVEFAGFG